MPRVNPTDLRKARALHPYLAKLLPVCRDLRSAQNELRWIRERVRDKTHGELLQGGQITVQRLVRKRARGEPLQYLLGTVFVGDLEIKCRPGVLIPRQETAASVTHLVDIIAARLATQPSPSLLRAVDLCTGSGCIPLLFRDEFLKHVSNRSIFLQIDGYDLSDKAIELACENRALQDRIPGNRTRATLHEIQFFKADILPRDPSRGEGQHVYTGGNLANSEAPKLDDWAGFGGKGITVERDILISNPPYVSPTAYKRTTARSVRSFEPKLALVPRPNNLAEDGENSSDEHQGDMFYPRLLDIAQKVSAKLVLLEVGDMEQAKRVVAMALQRPAWNIGAEIWKDDPSGNRPNETCIVGRAIRVVGEGNGRSVFIWRKDCDSLGITRN